VEKPHSIRLILRKLVNLSYRISELNLSRHSGYECRDFKLELFVRIRIRRVAKASASFYRIQLSSSAQISATANSRPRNSQHISTYLRSPIRPASADMIGGCSRKKPEPTTPAMVKTPPHQKPLPIPPLESGDRMTR